MEGDTEQVRRFTITCEDDAWNILRQATREKIEGNIELVFDGWPRYDINVKGKDWHRTVPTRIMGPLIDIQKDLQRAFAQIHYGEPNLRKLTDEQRDELELVVGVQDGSSTFVVELYRQLNELLRAAEIKMNGSELMTTIISLGLIFAGNLSFKQWIAKRQRDKDVDGRVELSREETERMRILAEAMAQKPYLDEARDNAANTQNKILKSVKPGDTLNVAGVTLSGYVANDLAHPERATAEDVYLSGVFKILGNRTDRGAGFRITVENVADGQILNAEVPPELGYEEKSILSAAEWGKGHVELEITGSKLRGNISRAVVTAARRPSGEASRA